MPGRSTTSARIPIADMPIVDGLNGTVADMPIADGLNWTAFGTTMATETAIAIETAIVTAIAIETERGTESQCDLDPDRDLDQAQVVHLGTVDQTMLRYGTVPLRIAV